MTGILRGGTVETERNLRIGVDCGGTNTDAVILDLTPNAADVVLGATKSPTTPEVTHGIQHAITKVLEQSVDIRAEAIQAVSIGTTHFVNALISRSTDRLARVAVIRLCGPFTRATAPFAGFPFELREILQGPTFMVEGGLQIDGSEISQIQEAEIEEACREIQSQGIQSIAICGVFAPIDFEVKQEETVEAIVKRCLPTAFTTVSHRVANIGLLERENATILNASLLPFARSTVQGFRQAADALGLTCPIFVTSNDGTLLSLAEAAALPIRTFSSGPTNSMRGASFLAQLADPDSKKETALVVDVGGTTTEVGVLLASGFPRQAASHRELCGVPLSFPMPHVTSVGLGGGSLVRQQAGSIMIGPDSVGYKISSEARVFGGDHLTATDVAVAGGWVSDIGDAKAVSDIDTSLVDAAQNRIRSMMERVMDSMKTSSKDIPVYLVGGGAFLIPADLAGISKVHRFAHYQCANAVGAAIAQVAGEVDVVLDIANTSMKEAQNEVERMAMTRAEKQGAKLGTIKIVESEAIPIAYTAGRCRFFAKAAGEWVGSQFGTAGLENFATEPSAIIQNERICLGQTDTDVDAQYIGTYRPEVKGGVWSLSALDLEFIAIGTYILGCGGGGDPSHAYLAAREMVRAGHTIKVVQLGSLDPTALCGWGGYLGSPEVTAERLFGNEYEEALRHLMQFIGQDISSLKGLIPLEIGGANGMINLLVAVSNVLDIPLIDGDFMGRAYPTAWQTTPNVYDEDGDRGKNLLPACVSSGDGNIMFMTHAKTSKLVDASLRAACTEMGTLIGYAARPLTAEFCRRAMIKNTTSLSWRLGRAVTLANKNANIGQIDKILIDALGGPETGRLLFSGKITHVSRRVYKGHTVGEVEITALSYDEEDDPEGERPKFSGSATIPFKNENLYLEIDAVGKKEIIASVPDLICVLDAQNGRALGTPDYKYGLRVLVLGVTASPQWTETKRGLQLGDLRAFGYPDIPYVPLGKYIQPRSVIEEFGR